LMADSYNSLLATLTEVMKPENRPAADTIVKAVRDGGGNDAACIKALRAAFGIRATLAEAIDDRMIAESFRSGGADAIDKSRRSVRKGADGTEEVTLPSGRGRWTPGAGLEDARKERERRSDIRKQLERDRKEIR